MVGWCLEAMLWYLTYVHPLWMGVRLLRKDVPNPDQVSNLTRAFAILWAVEIVDHVLLTHLLAARTLFVSLRIVFSLYLVSKRFLGASVIHQMFIEPVVQQHAPAVDALITSHLKEFRESGATKYLRNIGSLAVQKLGLAAKVVEIGKDLLKDERSDSPALM
jgi:hypothetical protein